MVGWLIGLAWIVFNFKSKSRELRDIDNKEGCDVYWADIPFVPNENVEAAKTDKAFVFRR